MTDVLGISNDLNVSLQKKEQYIANVMILVKVVKRRLQEKVEAFCIKHDISLPNFDDPYANIGRSQRKVLQELNNRFNEVTNDLLNGVSCLNQIDSFSSFDIKKIMRITELYLDDFDVSNMRALEN
ncbi:hypothetical protein H5410_056952 [Solanum commersonii]|uniref:Uncharacterized protein n=1 Tax=Solanum commersonii TaxID=4109 RepID=A0A9J5WMQ7_SOLCO|nr:hypothetical protein H5410_056952 [Solanum commersonii]